MELSNSSGLMTRRFFVGTATAAMLMRASAADGETPVLRIGAMSDDHFHPSRPETHRRSKACFELFRRMNVDIVVDTGDIADRSQVSELQLFRKMFDETFAGTSCVPFFCIANHDYNYVPNTRRNDPRNIENAWRALGMSCASPTAVVKGYQFVNVFQDESDHKAFGRAVAKAVAASEDERPVFVVNHVPPKLTTTGTMHWSSPAIRDVLNRYPQVVALTGHIHTAVKWAANIWQGEFTTINLGAHAEYSNKIAGEAVVLDVFADRIDVRRYEAVTGREIGADDRWSIPLPLDPMHGPYRPEARMKQCPVPAFPADATLTYEQSAAGDVGKLVFTAAEPSDAAYHYRMTFEAQAPDGTWTFLSTRDWSPDQVMEAPRTWSCSLAAAFLEHGRPHRVTLTPMNSHGVFGQSRTFSFDVPAAAMTPLSSACTRIERWQHGSTASGKPFSPDRDGWIDMKGGSALAVLSRDFSAAIQGKNSVSLVFDIATDQPDYPCTLSLGRIPASGGAVELGVGARIYTMAGKFASQRFVWNVNLKNMPNPEDEFCLVVREGGTFRGKVNSVKAYVR